VPEAGITPYPAKGMSLAELVFHVKMMTRVKVRTRMGTSAGSNIY